MKKHSKLKKITAVMTALLMAGTLTFPIVSLAAADNPSDRTLTELAQGNTMNNNYGVITTNNGNITTNHGKVITNKSIIITNNGDVITNKVLIRTNNGTVGDNDMMINENTDNGTVENNNITIRTNSGYITTNHGTVNENTENGIIENNNSTIFFNYGTTGTNKGIIRDNSGKIGTNTEGGNIPVNSGSITVNNSNVEGNSGTIEENTKNGIIDGNSGTVTDNHGMVNFNDGTITNNFGIVEKNEVTVVNNYGTVNGGRGAVTNQYYKIDLTNAPNVELSGEGYSYANDSHYIKKNGGVIIAPKKGYLISSMPKSTQGNVADNGNGTYTLSGVGAYTELSVVDTLPIVTDITGVPTTMMEGDILTLTGIVESGDTLNKTIVWSVKDAGTTGAIINGNMLFASYEGSVTVTATVANGLGTEDYTQDFIITVNKRETGNISQPSDEPNDLPGDEPGYNTPTDNPSDELADKQISRVETKELTEVPDGLRDIFGSLDELKAEMLRCVQVQGGYSNGNTIFYDIKLQISNDGGKTWVDATEDNFPSDGITVTLPYPSGTNGESHDFAVAHMFTLTSAKLGTTKGGVETPTPVELADGLQVTFKGLSPVSISWKAEEVNNTTGGAVFNDSETTSPKTGDMGAVNVIKFVAEGTFSCNCRLKVS